MIANGCECRTWFISVYIRPEVTRLRIGQLLAKECLSHPALDRNNIKNLVSDVMHDVRSRRIMTQREAQVCLECFGIRSSPEAGIQALR